MSAKLKYSLEIFVGVFLAIKPAIYDLRKECILSKEELNDALELTNLT